MALWPQQIDSFAVLLGIPLPDVHGSGSSAPLRVHQMGAITSLERGIGIVPEDWPATIGLFLDAGHNPDGSLSDIAGRVLCEPPAGAGEPDPVGTPTRYMTAHGKEYPPPNKVPFFEWSVQIPPQDDGGATHRSPPLVFANQKFISLQALVTTGDGNFGNFEDLLGQYDSDVSTESFSAKSSIGSSPATTEGGLQWLTLSRD